MTMGETMRNENKTSKLILMIGVLSLFWMGGLEVLGHVELEYVKYSDLRERMKGDGSRGDPYQIAHPVDFNWVRRNLSSHFQLVQNLDLGQNRNFKPIGGKKPFAGTFDGGGKIIKNLRINRFNEDGVGLFGWAGKNARIRDVSLRRVDIEGRAVVGGLVGRNFGRVEGSYARGKVVGKKDIGGFMGWNRGKVDRSYARGEVEGEEGIGGFMGWNGGEVERSYAWSEVKGKEGVGGFIGRNGGEVGVSYAGGKVEGERGIGGFIGWNEGEGIIRRSYAAGSVMGEEYIGGFIGGNEGVIKRSYARGRVMGGEDVGGFIGWNRGTIDGSYAAGKVLGRFLFGRLVGRNVEEGRIEGKNYWITGSANKGIGKNEGEVSHIKGKSKFKMILKELEWDLEIWIFPPGKHPELRWQSSSQ